MRIVSTLILHCTATPEGRDYTVADIDRWHRARGFRCIGYHYIIHLDGSIEQGRPIEQVGAHCSGHNQHSIGICYIGGLSADRHAPKDTRTPAQRAALRTLIHQLLQRFPNATVHGHYEFANKACPCFDVAEYATS